MFVVRSQSQASRRLAVGLQVALGKRLEPARPLVGVRVFFIMCR